MCRHMRVSSLPLIVAALSCLLASVTPRRAAAQPQSLPQSAILQQHDGDRDPGDAFGSAVAAWGTRLIVGAPGDDERGVDAGAAYVFLRKDGTWMFEAKLAPVTLRPGDAFGTSVSIDDAGAVVGAPGDDVVTNDAGAQIGTMVDRGAAYQFARSGTTWSLARRLQPFVPATDPGASLIGPGDAFGATVAIRGTVFVGAPGTDTTSGPYGLQSDAGAVYVFRGSVDQRLYPEPRPREAQHNFRFGRALALSDDAVVPRLLIAVAGEVREYTLPVGRGPWVWTDTHYPARYPSGETEGTGFNVYVPPGGSLVATAAGGVGHAWYDSLRSVTAEGRVALLESFVSTGASYAWVNGRRAFRYTERQIHARALDGTESFLAGDATKSYTDGIGIDAGFGAILSPVSDGGTGLYLADSNTIRHVGIDGAVVRLAGLQTVAGTADGVGVNARLWWPRFLAWDAPRATLYFIDGSALRALKPGNEVVTIAGGILEPGTVDGTGASARLSPIALSVAPDGNVVIAERLAIRLVTPAGVVTSLVPAAPSDPAVVDGLGTTRRVRSVTSVLHDPTGHLFILEDDVIRTLSLAGELRTVAGLPITGLPSASDSVAAGAQVVLAGNTTAAPPTASFRDTSGMAWVLGPGTLPQGPEQSYPLFPASGRDATMRFGTSVALGDGVAFVGSVHPDHAGPAVPVMGFDRHADKTWTQGLALTPTGIEMGADYGAGLAATRDEVFVGSPTSTQAVGGFVVVFDLDARDSDGDGLPDRWETRFGLDPSSTSGVDGATGDRDGDGQTNAEEFADQTHPAADPALTRYFAEGATTWDFRTRLFVANPGTTPANVQLRFLRSDGVVHAHALAVAPMARQVVDVGSLVDMEAAEFSTMIESDALVVADRVVDWPRDNPSGGPYGSHAERAVTAPAMTWYFAEGATHSGFNLFYLLQNPSAQPVHVRVRYLRPSGAPLEKAYVLPARSRSNIWVDTEVFDAPGGPATLLDNTDVAAVIEALDGPGIIVERALYRDGAAGRPFEAGHESAGVTAPATSWFLAEGATGDFFDTFILVANPTDTPAEIRVTFLLDDGRTFTRDLTVGANARTNVWADVETFDDGLTYPMANVAFSTTLSSLNAVPIIVERSLWWPGPTFATWHETHNSFGSTETGTLWVAAFGEVPQVLSSNMYLLIANPTTEAATVRVTLLGDTGPGLAKSYTVAAKSRFNVDMAAEFLGGNGSGSFGAVVESLGAPGTEIVIERATYTAEPGLVWSAGTGALLTKVR